MNHQAGMPPKCPESCLEINWPDNCLDCDKYWQYRAELSEKNRQIHEKEE
jgi:hypothetical protein